MLDWIYLLLALNIVVFFKLRLLLFSFIAISHACYLFLHSLWKIQRSSWKCQERSVGMRVLAFWFMMNYLILHCFWRIIICWGLLKCIFQVNCSCLEKMYSLNIRDISREPLFIFMIYSCFMIDAYFKHWLFFKIGIWM